MRRSRRRKPSNKPSRTSKKRNPFSTNMRSRLSMTSQITLSMELNSANSHPSPSPLPNSFLNRLGHSRGLKMILPSRMNFRQWHSESLTSVRLENTLCTISRWMAPTIFWLMVSLPITAWFLKDVRGFFWSVCMICRIPTRSPCVPSVGPCRLLLPIVLFAINRTSRRFPSRMPPNYCSKN